MSRTALYSGQKNPPPLVSTRWHVPGDIYSDLLLQRYAPSCLISNDRYELLYLNGWADAYLKFPKRQVNMNLLNMVSADLQAVLQEGFRLIKKRVNPCCFQR
ncbi:MAG: hypothetical protein HC880_11485 [Bacteroidia bacterium]|nr:hypothetical protein [Bacteroidia bacterium]